MLNGHVDLARMLLAHRANPNLGYHGVILDRVVQSLFLLKNYSTDN